MSNEEENTKIAKWIAIKEEKHTTNEYLQEIKQVVEEVQKKEEFKKELEYYTALGNKIRYSMFKLLEKKPLCTCVLARIFELREATISHHLKILEKAGLIIGVKKGAFISYHTKINIFEELRIEE